MYSYLKNMFANSTSINETFQFNNKLANPTNFTEICTQQVRALSQF